jgi:hypothetical protein
MKEGMRIVQKPRITRILKRCQSATCDGGSIKRQNLETCLAEIGLKNKAIMAGTEHNQIEIICHI